MAVILIDAENDDPAADHLNDERPEDDPECGAAAPAETGTTDDGGGDNIKLIALAVAGGSRAIVAEGEEGSDASSEARDEIDAQLDPFDANAAKASGEFVPSDGVDAAAGGQVGSANAIAGGLNSAASTPLNYLLYSKLLGGGADSGGVGPGGALGSSY